MIVLLIWGVWAILSNWWDRHLLAALMAAVSGSLTVIVYSNRHPLARWLRGHWRLILIMVGVVLAVLVLKP